MNRKRPPSARYGKRSGITSPADAVARVTMWSCKGRGSLFRSSALAWTTATFESASIPRARERNAHFFTDASRTVTRAPGRYRANGMPGYPAPEPKSRMRPGNGANRRSRRESATCFTATSTGSVMAVRRIDRFHRSISLAWSASSEAAPGKDGIPASARTSRNRSGETSPPPPLLFIAASPKCSTWNIS